MQPHTCILYNSSQDRYLISNTSCICARSRACLQLYTNVQVCIHSLCGEDECGVTVYPQWYWNSQIQKTCKPAIGWSIWQNHSAEGTKLAIVRLFIPIWDNFAGILFDRIKWVSGNVLLTSPGVLPRQRGLFCQHVLTHGFCLLTLCCRLALDGPHVTAGNGVAYLQFVKLIKYHYIELRCYKFNCHWTFYYLYN